MKEKQKQLLNKIADIVKTHPQTCSKIILANKELIQFIESTYSFNFNFKTFAEKLYWITHNISEIPKCPICGRSLENKYLGIVKGYQHHCSNKCAQLDDAIQEKIKQTTLLKHGSENYRNVEKQNRHVLKNMVLQIVLKLKVLNSI